MAARFRLPPCNGRMSGDFLPKHCILGDVVFTTSLFVSFDCDSLSEELKKENAEKITWDEVVSHLLLWSCDLDGFARLRFRVWTYEQAD